jgi:hypothetical protein
MKITVFSVMLSCVVWYKLTNISEVLTASIIRASLLWWRMMCVGLQASNNCCCIPKVLAFYRLRSDLIVAGRVPSAGPRTDVILWSVVHWFLEQSFTMGNKRRVQNEEINCEKYSSWCVCVSPPASDDCSNNPEVPAFNKPKYCQQAWGPTRSYDHYTFIHFFNKALQ